MRKIAYNIRKEYQSTCDIDTLTENLTKVFAYLKDNADSVGYSVARLMVDVYHALKVGEKRKLAEMWE